MSHPAHWGPNVVPFRRRRATSPFGLAATLWLAGIHIAVLPARCALAMAAALSRG